MTNDVLSDRDKQVATMYAQNLSIPEIAQKVGVSQNRVYQLLKQPNVQSELYIIVGNRLRLGASIAVNVIDEIMRDPKASPAVRLAAAKDTLDRAGFTPPKDGGASAVPISEKTASELRSTLENIEAELAARAITVQPAPSADDILNDIND